MLMLCCWQCIAFFLPGFIVTSADISKLWVYLLFTNLLPEAICCCLQTCNVYGAWVTLYCICVQTFVVTCAKHQLVIGTLGCLEMYCLRLFVVVYKLVMLMLCCY